MAECKSKYVLPCGLTHLKCGLQVIQRPAMAEKKEACGRKQKSGTESIVCQWQENLRFSWFGIGEVDKLSLQS